MFRSSRISALHVLVPCLSPVLSTKFLDSVTRSKPHQERIADEENKKKKKKEEKEKEKIVNIHKRKAIKLRQDKTKLIIQMIQ